MNHDNNHCADYDPQRCTAGCYRAKLTEEARLLLKGVSIPYQHFKGTTECPLGTSSFSLRTPIPAIVLWRDPAGLAELEDFVSVLVCVLGEAPFPTVFEAYRVANRMVATNSVKGTFEFSEIDAWARMPEGTGMKGDADELRNADQEGA